MTTKMSPVLPRGEEFNGLNSITQDMIDSPDEIHWVVAGIRTRTIQTNVETGTTRPTAQIMRIEVVKEDHLVKAITDVMMKSAEERTGKRALPLDQVEIVHTSETLDGQTGDDI